MKVFVRRLAGAVVNFIAWCTRPEQIARSELERKALASELKALRIYDYKGCPRSLKLLQLLHRLNLNIEYCDIQKCQVHQDNLLAQIGRLHAPCLRIHESHGVRWLDDSDRIMDYLRQRFDPTCTRHSPPGPGLSDAACKTLRPSP